MRAELQDSWSSVMTRPATYRRAGRPAGVSGASAMIRRAATLRGPGREPGERCERNYRTAGRA